MSCEASPCLINCHESTHGLRFLVYLPNNCVYLLWSFNYIFKLFLMSCKSSLHVCFNYYLSWKHACMHSICWFQSVLSCLYLLWSDNHIFKLFLMSCKSSLHVCFSICHESMHAKFLLVNSSNKCEHIQRIIHFTKIKLFSRTVTIQAFCCNQ